MEFRPMRESDVLALNVLALAYVGDAVQSLFVRDSLVRVHNTKAGQLHRMASDRVKASAQADLAERLADDLTETETEVYHRGRNSSPSHHAKNQTSADYRKATGLEAVLGYLYLTGKHERLVWLLTQL